jgi:hypothetical protein
MFIEWDRRTYHGGLDVKVQDGISGSGRADSRTWIDEMLV